MQKLVNGRRRRSGLSLRAFIENFSVNQRVNYGVGAKRSTAHFAIHTDKAALQAKIAGGVPTPTENSKFLYFILLEFQSLTRSHRAKNCSSRLHKRAQSIK
jgi:hypothetical protein